MSGKNTGFFERRWPSLLVLAALTFAVYSNTLSNGFVYDDNDLVLRNPWIRDWGHLKEIFTSSIGEFLPGVASGTYRPMIHVVYAAAYSLFGLEPWGYHLVNMFLQCAVTWAVFLLSSRLIPERPAYAFVSALYFAIHPVHSEVVAWVSTMAEMFFTLLILASFSLHARERGSAIQKTLTAILFLAALLFKETALVFVPLAFVYDLSVRRSWKPLSRDWKRYLFYMAPVALYFALRSLAAEAVPGRKWFDITAWQYFLNIFPLLPLYFYKLLLPVNLSAYYYIEPATSILEPKVLFSLGFLSALGYTLYRLYYYDRVLFFALAWVPVSIIPTLYLPGLGKSFFAERYLYLPSVGLSILIGAIGGRMVSPVAGRKARGLVIVIALIASALLAAQTFSRNRVWKSDLLLWTDTVGKSRGALPRYNLGLELARLGQTEMAIKEFEEALKIDPRYEDALFNLGVIYETKGLYRLAEERYRGAISVRPGSADAHLGLGRVYMKTGRRDEAAAEFAVALKIDKDLAEARLYLKELQGR